MKSRVLGQGNKNENTSLFSSQYYQNIQTNQEKRDYLLNCQQYFITRLDQQNNQRQKISPSLIQSFRDFSEIFSNSYSLLLPDNFDDIIKTLTIENSILETIPNASNFLQLIDLIFYQCYQKTDANKQKISSNAIYALFSSQSFCRSFINSGKYLDTIMALINYSNSQLTNYFFDDFLNENFIQFFIEEDAQKALKKETNQKLNCSKFVFTFFSRIFLFEATKDETRYQLLEFGSKLIVNIFNSLNKDQITAQLSHLFIKELSSLSLFSRANEFFITHPSVSFIPLFYGNLLLNLSTDNSNKQFNPIVLNHLHSLYNDDRFSVEDGKVFVMHFFQTLNINYFSSKSTFRVLDWINETVFESSLLFQVTSSFLTKCVYYDASFLLTFFDFFIEKVAPPFKEKFVYNEIFSWLLSLISLLIEDDNKKKFFDVHKFLKETVFGPSISDVSYYIDHFFNFRQLLLHISIISKESDKRNTNPKKIYFTKKGQIIQNTAIQFTDSIFDNEYFSRVIELIEFNQGNESIREFFLSYLKNSFGKNLILYFIENINHSNLIQNLFYSFTKELVGEIIEIILNFELLNEIIPKINESNFIPILKIFNSIVIQTNNHFLDDFIINNYHPDLKFFKLDFNQAEKFILPAFYEQPIPIPSLVPFLDVSQEKMNFKSPYNHYLLGFYAMPIYNKLNSSISRIICLEEIFNQFIRYQDFCYVFQNGAKEASIKIQPGKKPQFPFNLYEFFPTEKPSSIQLNLTSNFAAFKIRFESKFHFPSVLFNVNGSPFLFIKDDYLIDISNTSIGQIELSKWHLISFYYNKSSKSLSIGLDSNTKTVLFSSSFYKIDSIGSSQKPTKIHYMVMNSICIGNTPDSSTFSEEIASKYFMPTESVLFVPNYSFHHLFQSRYAFSQFCEMIEKVNFEKNHYNDKLALFIPLFNNWILTNSISSEWYLNRYRYCLLQNVTFCEPFYLTSILQTIIKLNRKADRTKLFYYFICDYFFWTKFPERIISQCLDFINNFIDDFSIVFDFKMLEETTICHFLLSLTYFFKKSYIFNGLIRFLKTLFSFFDDKYFAPQLSNFALISPYLNGNEIEMIFNFEKNQEFGNTIISFAKEIRIMRKVRLFKMDELLSLSLMLNDQQLSINFIMRILQICDSDQFINQYLSVLCRIVSRFPSNNLIWQKLFQLVTNDKNFVLSFNHDPNQYNFGNIRLTVLPLILSALVPLFNEETKFSENIKKIVFHLLKENQLNLISKSTIKVFCSFLRGSIFDSVPSNMINQTSSQNAKINDFYSIFIENVNRTFVSSKRPNDSFYQYTSMLLSSILFNQVSNFKRFSLILNIAVHSSNYFLIQVLIQIYSTYIHHELTNQQLTLLNDVSLHALLSEKSIKNRDSLSNNVFIYCIHNHDRFVHFSKFFVFSYRCVSDDVKFRTLRAFHEYFTIQPPKVLNDIVPYLYVIVCTDLNHVLCKKKDALKINDNENNSPKNMIRIESKNRLMNLKRKVPTTTVTDSTNQVCQTDSFALEIFSYFLANFKSFPKESKLNLLLKFKSYSDLISFQKLNANDNDLNQVKNYISSCMKSLQEEAYACYKVVDLKGVPVQQDNLGVFLFNHFTDVTQKCKNFFSTLFSDMNYFLRHVEKYYGSFINMNNKIKSQNFSADMLGEISQSYHISPFYFPGFCPVVLIPSPFSVLKNDKELNDETVINKICSNKIELNLFGLEKLNTFTYLNSPESKIDLFNKFGGFFDYQSKNHKMRVSFVNNNDNKTRKINVYNLRLNPENSQQQKILLFESIYGRPLQILNCNLIRRFIDIPAVLFKYKTRYLILPNCEFDGDEISFNFQPSNSALNLTSSESFYHSIFLNEFGQYYLFLGHPVILVNLNDFIISHQCTDDTITFSVGIFSSANGSFVLSFSRENISFLQSKYQQNLSQQQSQSQQQMNQNDQVAAVQVQEENVVDPPTFYLMTTIESLKPIIIEKWLKGNFSNIHYLTLLNLLSGRSFDDLSSYPIMPRVLSTFNGKSFRNVYRQNLRDLQFPVSVLSEALKSKSQFELELVAGNNSDDSVSVGDEFDNCNESTNNNSSSASFKVDLSDPCFNSLKMRYEMQKYHNCENISNGSIVSSFLIRIPPFINYSLEFNDGNFDVPDRMFTSIELSCNINKFSTSELIPELFLLPEMLNNRSNKLKFPDGFSEKVELPNWCSDRNNREIDCYNFIMMHRSMIESFSVKKEISKWIDLVFGFKQSGEEAVNSFNVYNPLSYQSSFGSLPTLSKSATSSLSQCQLRTMRTDFVKNSGQMPLKLFSSPHQQFSTSLSLRREASALSSSSLNSVGLKDKRSSPTKNHVQAIFDKNRIFGFNFNDIEVKLQQTDGDDNYSLNRSKGEVSIHLANSVFKIFNDDFFNAKNIFLSKRRDFLAVTFCTSKVKIYRLYYFDVQAQQNQGFLMQNPHEQENNFSFAEMAVFTRESIRFSVINDRQFLCASVCKEEVVLWSIVNGFIIHIIPIKNVECLAFDEILNLIYIGVANKVYQLSINGLHLRTIDTDFVSNTINNNLGNLDDSVESIAVGGFGFSYDMRFVVVGKRSGKVLIFKQNRENLAFEIVSAFEVSNYPIVKLLTKQNNFLVEAIDSLKASSTVL